MRWPSDHRPRGPASSPLRGHLLVRSWAGNASLRLNDLVLGLLHRRDGGAVPNPVAPKRVLVAIGGHLGDAVIASSVLPRLAHAFPGVEIGVVCASWNRRVFESHPRVRWIHAVDHWKLARSGAPFPARWLTTRRMRADALSGIRAIGYDVAIDLAAYFPNSARLLWKADIPIRIGYTSSGNGPLYTHPVAWSSRDHVADEHGVLLERLTPLFSRDAPARYDLPEPAPDAVARATHKLSALGVPQGAYVVVHMGAGHPRKEWPTEKWIAIVRDLTALGERCVLTGAGESQTLTARRVAESVHGAVSLSDALDWNELRAVIAASRLVLSVDTVTMHLAGAAGIPCVALMPGIDRPERWRPLGSPLTLLTERVPCAPCFRSNGCLEMSCIRDVTTESVLHAAREHLSV